MFFQQRPVKLFRRLERPRFPTMPFVAEETGVHLSFAHQAHKKTVRPPLGLIDS